MSTPAEARTETVPSVRLTATPPPGTADLLDDGLLALLGELGLRYRDDVDSLLELRVERQRRYDAGEAPEFEIQSRELRDRDWRVAPIPDDLRDRRVEITGPVGRKMVINALNSGARVFMADFEDSTTPTWSNLMNGQRNLYDAARRTIDHRTPDGREYTLRDDPAVLMVRPRGWHLDECHVQVGGRPLPGAIFDAAVYLYHNAGELPPYLYLPKLENADEAALWQRVLADIERSLGLKVGTVKVTVLIETIGAAFQMDEILFALRSRVVGLNCGRWDYIFSYIKRLRAHPDKVLPERAQVTMDTPFLRAYSRLLIRTCHRRGALAMGGMAAQIPVKGDEAANRAALDKVRLDKEREAKDGHDGTWVAHPGLIPVAAEVFDRHLDGPNQMHTLREDVMVSARDLLTPCAGTITEAGVRGNIAVAIRYLAAWLGGSGCVPLDHLMEDAATAEISRAQLWQWARHEAGRLDDGRDIDLELLQRWHGEELDAIRAALGPDAFADGRFEDAAALLWRVTADDDFVEFITMPAYQEVLRHGD